MITRRAGESDLDFVLRRLAMCERTAQDRYNETKRLRRELGAIEADKAKTEELLGKVLLLRKENLQVPDWMAEVPDAGERHIGRPFLLLSDLHLDEVVDPDTMGGVNAFNREIAHQRFERVINQAVDFPKNYWGGVTYDGIVCALAGDIVTGTIHEELAETNDDTLPGTIAHWTPAIASALKYLADNYGRVFVPIVDGNHDRSHKKPRHKRRARDSWMWVMAAWLADVFKDDDRIQITMSESSELIVPIYNTRILLVHGDGAQGGQGIGGIWPPIMRYVYKKQSVYSSLGKRFDQCWMGHWHQLVHGPTFLVNGSLKGYDEYAKSHGFSYEPPAQALGLITPERGITQISPLFAE